MKKFLSILLLMAIILLTFSGCSFFDKSYNVIYALSSTPKNIDPQTATENDEFIVINNLFEGIYTIDESGKLVYAAAKEVQKSSDGLSYKITLRDDMLWSNDQKLTAYDFEFAFIRLLSPETQSSGASKFFCIKNASKVNSGEVSSDSLGVKAVSEYELLIELEYVKNDFEYLLSSTYAMPCNKEFFYSTKGKYGLDGYNIISNGPFELYSWKDNDSIRLVKNEVYYAKDLVLPDGVKLLTTAIEDKIESLNEEKIDAALIDGSLYSQIENKGYSTEEIETAVWGIGMNTKNSYLSNKDIRKAIAYCFDKSLYEDRLSDNLHPTSVIIPNGVYVNDIRYREKASEVSSVLFDINKAKSYLNSGLKAFDKTKIEPLNLLVCKDDNINFSEYFSYSSQIFQKELSLYINIVEVSESEYYSKLNLGDFDLVIYKLKSQDNTPYSILSNFNSLSSNNYLSYQSTQYDDLFDSVSSSKDSDNLISLYEEMEDIILEDAVFIPMFFTTDYFVQAKNVTGVQYIPSNGMLSFKHAKK